MTFSDQGKLPKTPPPGFGVPEKVSRTDQGAWCGHHGHILHGKCIACLAADRDRFGEALEEIRDEANQPEGSLGAIYAIASAALEQPRRKDSINPSQDSRILNPNRPTEAPDA